MQELPYYQRYLKQEGKCAICNLPIKPEEYCVINLIQGVRVIHEACRKEVKIEGCYFQMEILYKPKK